MRREFLMGAAVVALALASPVSALPTGFKAKADALLAQSYAADGPGASVVISEGGKIVYVGTRGLADIAAKKPITPDTVFRIGSITKQFAAAVVLQLAAEGKLKLDDPLSKFLPDYPNGAAITVAQLLNHTSGIQSYTDIPGWMAAGNAAKAFSTTALTAEFKDLPAPTKPGQAWAYNNSGYILVGAVIEKVTGKPWYQAVDERIIQPLGLKSMRYGVDEEGVTAMARGYRRDDDGIVPARTIHMSVPGAAGALIGTPSDLAAWGYALHHGKVVPAPFYAQMITPTKLPDASSVPYGYGLQTETLRGLPAIGHGGGIFGFSTDSLFVPAENLFVAVYTNSDSPDISTGTTLRRVAALAMGKPFVELTTVPLDAAAVKPFLGVYKFAKAERILTLRDGKLYAQRVGRPPSELFAAGGGRYHYGPDELSWLELARDTSGKPVVNMHPGGDDAVDLGIWTGPPPAETPTVEVPRATLERLAGNYTAPIGKIAIALGDAGLTIQLAGQSALPMRAIGPMLFLVDRVGAEIRFIEEGGKVTGLELVQGGQKLPATRD